jgi:uncharacterized membrane protein
MSKIKAGLQRYFLAGLLIWLPILATVWVIHFIVNVLDQVLLLLPASASPRVWLGVDIPGFGVIISLLILLGTGVLAANFFGKRLFALWERLIHRVPLVRSVYGSVKQVAQSFLEPGGNSFKKVVLVEYPRRDMWSIAFQTTDNFSAGREQLPQDHVMVFIPTTPNPTSGFLLIVPANEVKEMNLSVEDAIKMVISLGVVQPKGGKVK